MPDPHSMQNLGETPQISDKAWWAAIGVIVTAIAGLFGKFFGFLDGGRRHRLDQLNLALKQIEQQQVENTKIRQEHESKIQALEAKMESMRERVMEAQSALILKSTENSRLMDELQQTRAALDVSNRKVETLSAEVHALNARLERLRKRRGLHQHEEAEELDPEENPNPS